MPAVKEITWFYVLDLGPDPTGRRWQQEPGGFDNQDDAEKSSQPPDATR
ncbi:MAG: hypothetical protein WD942_11895 [Dehalococcoidia bacterium]